MKFDLPRGMRDIESEEYENINTIKNAFYDSVRIFNFKIMEPSPLELLSTLESKSGPSIINEIYSFIDKGNRKVALRFDLTIGLTRYFVSRRDLKIPAKIASFGGVWRYDEPQSGRYRFFHQWDIEIYGSNSLESDTEIIEFTSVFLKKLGLNEIIIDISSRELLEEYIKKNLDISDEETLFEIFRAIDKVSKKGKVGVKEEYKEKIKEEILEKALIFAEKKGNYEELKHFMEPLDLTSWENIKKVIRSLSNRKVNNIRINLGIVRGLDYYSGIVFEAIDPENNFGSLVGGGRYNKLTETFGRKDMGATGAAGGIERIILAMKKREEIQKNDINNLICIVYDSPEMISWVEKLGSSLRRENKSVEYDLIGRSLSKQISDAENKNAKNIIIFNLNEMKINGNIILRTKGEIAEKKLKVDENFDEINKALDEVIR
ncbi:MAG TPA: histidine--tRNA ligase [Verrucomicrobiae bacterium]|nr:histidine--tRNA ligase [Verrucomicrobiae bacterium]